MRKLLLALLFAAASPLAQAQWMAGLSIAQMTIWPPLNLNLTTPGGHKPVAQQKKPEPPMLAPAGTDVQANARDLAARFPAERRAEVEQVFRQSMDFYGQVMKKLAIPERDMAASLAAFIAGNYRVMHETDVPDEDFQALVRQLRQQPSLSEMSRRAESGQLRKLYEQSAMVGTFMTLTWKSHQRSPQPPQVWSNVRDSARANLQAVLQTDPSRLRLDKNGMRLAQ
jgi:hypothetical protein